MVRDKKPSRKRTIKRRSSWKDTIKGFSGGESEGQTQPSARSSSSHLRIPSKSAPGRTTAARRANDEGAFADAESDSDSSDFGTRKEEDRPISARILYKYPNGQGDLPRSNSALERQQEELSLAIARADTTAIKAITGKEIEGGRKKELLGTRLTMTSRTGYFQDRIISPSMVCNRLLCWAPIF